jgi:hypothetical protein
MLRILKENSFDAGEGRLAAYILYLRLILLIIME